MNKHTQGPWEVGEYEDDLGYDCMTGGVRVGPVVLDGRDYGQKRCEEITAEQLERMLADARLIASAPELLEVVTRYMFWAEHGTGGEGLYALANEATAKARGE